MPRSIVFSKIRVIWLFYCNFAQVVLLSRTKRHINRSATACFMLLFPQKIPLDFTCQIRYNKRRSQMICRCVGMADEGDSKSLVLITRVGSTPTTGIKREPPPARLAGVLFLSAACKRVVDPHYFCLIAKPSQDKNQRNIQIVYLRYAIQRCSCCIKKLNCQKATITCRVPLRLACARQLRRLKAPLGLSLLRNRGILISKESKKSEPFSYREKVRIFIVWCG